MLRYFPLLLVISFLLSACSKIEMTATQSPLHSQGYSLNPAEDHSGMWPLTGIAGSVYQTLKEMGAALSPDQIYSTSSPSLNQAVVRINIGADGGGTGSFVSQQGLVLTNHHVAYDGIVAASSPGINYLNDGFYAGVRNEEIPIPEYSLYILIEQTDVTDIINNQIPAGRGNRETAQIKAQIEHELVTQRKKGNPGLEVEIDDYWYGNRQIMSVYKVIKDVRLVYAPPHFVGKFGGDIDNWMWPRHTGDFAFLRAYVASDGSSKPYQPGNIPYIPEYVLPVRIGELAPGDFTLVMGYPGTTSRFESSYAFDFYESQQFPVLEKAFRAYLTGLEYDASQDPETAMFNAGERASIANALKYYEGLQAGFATYGVTAKKRLKEREFHSWVQADSLRRRTYGNVLPQLEQSYNIAGHSGDILFLSFYALQYSRILQMGSLFDDFYEYSMAPDSIFFSSDERQELFDYARLWYSSMNPESERIILTELLKAMAGLPPDRRPLVFYRFFDSAETAPLQHEITEFMNRQSATSILFDTTAVQSLVYEQEEITAFEDSLYLISRDIHAMFEQSRENYIQHFNYLLPAQKRYTQGMMEMEKKPHQYPDANFTLRVTGGKVNGYSPADGIFYTPFSTHTGLLAKTTGKEPFVLPSSLENYLQEAADENHLFGPYASAAGTLVLNFLSTNDITGGNSGSPVLNANGELIGVAFDGNIEGIVSDYHFIPEVTRTISVDIRYILFLMDKIDNTERLLRELEIRRN